MKKHLAFLPVPLVVLILSLPAFSQNLVPNPGFEALNLCPTGMAAIKYDAGYTNFPYVQSWINPVKDAPNGPDAFNRCSPVGSGIQVPEIDLGYQQPRTGDGFAGIVAWEANQGGSYEYREYIQCRLQQLMVPGQRYCVSLNVSVAISSIFNFNYVGIDQLDINFSASKPTQSTGYTMSLPAHVSNTPGSYFTDTAGWIKITGNYIATGGEQWMTIGCFSNGLPPNFTPIYPITPNPSGFYRCYLYIDDLSVMPVANDTLKKMHQKLSCKEDGFTMELESSTAESTYLWNTGSASRKISVSETGTYWALSYDNCQVVIDSFHVFFDPNKILSLGKDTGNCLNQPITLQANSNFNGHLWNTGQTTPTITVSQSGAYILTAVNDCGIQTDTIEIFIQPPTTPPAAIDTTICQFIPNPQLSVQGSNINWYTHANGIFGFPHQPAITTSLPEEFLFYVSETVGKCESEKVPVRIRIKYAPQEELPDTVLMCERFPDSIGEWHADVSYKWSTGQPFCCMVPRHEGLYKLTVSNECGIYSDSVRVLFSLCDSCIVVPNAFTPRSKDGRNEIFRPLLTCPVTQFRMQILNRWGNMVFNTHKIEEGWNGTFNDSDCENGVYVYMIEYRSSATGRPKLLYGTVTLLR